jgi:uncharacterized protein (DUF2252 family)
MVDSLDSAEVSSSQDVGRSLRKEVPRSSQADWTPPADRRNAVDIVEAQNADRVPWLVPLRRGRMSASAFTFFRGSAAIMAADLATTPTSGLTVQLSGDGHLSNFGVYGSPERNLVFDLNDFDETLPGPFEWDVKRLAASFTIAGQHRGFGEDTQRGLAETSVLAYRSSMRHFASQGWLETWYAHVGEQELIELVKDRGASKKEVKRMRKAGTKARSRDSLKAATKLVEKVDGEYRFQSSPPVLVPLRDLPETQDIEDMDERVEASFSSYRSSLSDDIRSLVDHYELVDVALKVVGVGSVGTRCLVALCIGRGPTDVLLLQIKEATSSVLEAHLPKSRYQLHGRRVVEGQRLMQASSDIFLGWSKSVQGHHYYWRQLKDWKGSADLDAITGRGLEHYAEICGYTMARAHAASGDPAAIAAYLGKGTVFDKAIGEFAMQYANQNAADYQAFTEAIDGGLPIEYDADS